MRQDNKLRIIWAVDALSDIPHSQIHSLKAIRYFFKDAPIEITPVSVLLLDRLDRNSALFTSTWDVARDIAERQIASWVKKIPTPGLNAPRFLTPENGHSTRAAVNALVDYAKETESDAIVVATHARKGIDRFLVGSFAETLVLQSDVPVLVVRPGTKLKGHVKSVVYPTDFSAKSRVGFEEVVALCQVAQSKLLLLHIAEFLRPAGGYPFVPAPISLGSLTDHEKSLKDTGEQWSRWANHQGVQTKFHLSKGRGNKVDEILRVAKKLGSSGAIAMASLGGSLEVVVTGSVTRQVIRQALCPVFVVHPESSGGIGNAVRALETKMIPSFA